MPSGRAYLVDDELLERTIDYHPLTQRANV